MTDRFQSLSRDLFDAARYIIAGSPVAITIIAINAAMFSIQAIAFGGSEPAALYRMGAKFGPAIQDGDWFRLVTPVLLHSDITHLTVNNVSLLMIGVIVERQYGGLYFSAIYVVAGLWGVVASFLNSPVLSVGASGALFGIVGALAVYLFFNRKLIDPDERRLLGLIVLLIIISLIVGQFWPGIDQAAHFGGLVAGIAMAIACTPRLRLSLRFENSPVPAPAAYVTSVRASPIVVLLALLALLIAAAGAAYWWAQNVEYGPAIMAQYRQLIWELAVRDALDLQ